MRNLFIIVFICFSAVGFSQEEKDLSEEERKTLLVAFPAAFYTPETEWGFGAGGVLNFYINKEDTISPSSQIQLGGSYTLRNQILLYLPMKFYWDEFKNVVELELGYYDYIYPFFGLGENSLEENREDYNSRFFRLRLDALRKVKGNTYAGLRYWLDTQDIYELQPNGILDLQDLLGKEGGVISGVGPQLRIDKRDNIYNPKTGSYVNTFIQKFSPAIGSEFNFSRLRLDARTYVLKGKTTIATQLYTNINWGDVPFFEKARLGGPKFLRGHIEGRFADNVSLVPQIELRRPIYKKRWGGVLFLSSGTVAPRVQDISFSNWNYTFGTGIRYMLDTEKGVNARFDVAFTPEGYNFYVTIGEAF